MRTAVLGLLLSMSTACAAIDDINLFTVEEDIELGRQLKAEIEANPADYPVLDPSAYPEAYDHLYRIADEVLASGDIEYRDTFDWEFYLIEDDATLNAFAAPGGYIWVYSGLIKFLDEEDDLAGVLGHEIAHADRRHATKQLTKAYGLEAVLGVVLGDDAGAIADLAAGLVGLEFSREDESEADDYSVFYLCDTVYAADGAASFFEQIESSGLPAFLSTHPDPENRVEAIRGLAEELGCNTDSWTAGDYEAFKAALP
jgi:predicted Zn-dependent protease